MPINSEFQLKFLTQLRAILKHFQGENDCLEVGREKFFHKTQYTALSIEFYANLNFENESRTEVISCARLFDYSSSS